MTRTSIPRFSKFAKFIYVSRLKPNVSEQMILPYVKSKIPDLNENDFSLMMLVKKDQKLDELTFISYRFGCTNELFDKLIDPSFWPPHMMIGEFIERSREEQNELGDFFYDLLQRMWFIRLVVVHKSSIMNRNLRII